MNDERQKVYTDDIEEILSCGKCYKVECGLCDKRELLRHINSEIEKKDKYITYLQRKLSQANITYRSNL